MMTVPTSTAAFQQSVWRLRAALFLLMALLLLLPVGDQDPGRWMAVGAALLWSWHARPGRRHGPPVLEAAIAALILWLGSASAHLAAASTLCFAVCHIALHGPRAAASVMVLCILTAPITITSKAATVPWLELGSGLLLAIGTLAVAGLAFTRQQSVHRRLGGLVHRAERMSFYLPDLLRPRLRDEPLPPCQLERSWLVLVFLDQVGFTRFSISAQSTEVEQRVQAFVRDVRALARCHGGVVMKLLGDGALLAFQADDDARRSDACRRAINFVIEACATVGMPAAVRAGVAAGTCSMGDWGIDDLLDFTVIGPAVNLSARLQAMAAPGCGLMCEETARLLGVTRGRRVIEVRGLGGIPVFDIG